MRMCKFCVFAGSKKAAYAVRYTKTSHESGHHNEGGKGGGCGRGGATDVEEGAWGRS